MNSEFRPPHWSQFLGINFRKLGLGMLLLVGGAYLALVLAGIYDRNREAMLIRRAVVFLRSNDVNSASLTLRQALKRNPSNLQATRMMAELSEAFDSRSAVLWFERVCELDDGRLEHLLQWANAALKYGEFESMAQALQKVGERGEAVARFQELSGMLALAQHRYREAESAFLKAAELRPDLERYQLNLAVVRLQSGAAETLEAARETLIRLAADPDFATEANRALVAAALKEKDFAAAIRYSEAVVAGGKATTRDRIYHLNALLLQKSPNLGEALSRTQLALVDTPGGLNDLTGWMCQNGLATECLAWLDGLPAARRDNDAYRQARAFCLVQLRQWAKVRVELNGQAWQELEFLRLGYLSLAEKQLGNHQGYVSRWRDAEHAVLTSLTGKFMLARQAVNWGWIPEAESLYWGIAAGVPGRLQALGALHRIYLDRKDELQLFRVASSMLEMSPEAPMARNNQAQLAMLLGLDLEQAYRLAEENYRRSPTNSVFLSTQAYAKYLQGKPDEAVELMSQVPRQYFKVPGLAGYYGLFLTAAGNLNEARPYLDTALAGDELLPTERKLITQARARIP